MDEIKSLADQLRNKIALPIDNEKPAHAKKKPKSEKPAALAVPAILDAIRAYDNSDHKNMVHVRFDVNTTQTMNHLKMATGIEITKLVAFSVQQLFKHNPELKIIIKQFIQNLEL